MPFLAGICALGATLALSRALTAREQAQLQSRTDAEAKHVAAQLRSAMLNALEVLPQMGEWWLSQGRPVSPEDWNQDAQLFLRGNRGLRQVVWFNPSGKPVWCLRPGAVPDFRCRAVDPEMAVLARHSADGRPLALSPVLMREGAVEFYAATPMHRDRLVGFLGGAFDAAELVQSLLKDQMPGDYQLAIAADGHPVAALRQGTGPFWHEGVRTANVKIANRWWSLELVPAMSGIRRQQRVVWGFGVIVSVLIYTCAGLALVYKRNESTLRFEVAERRRAEAQIAELNRDLQNQVDDFRTLLDVLPIGIAISEDPACREIRVNPRLAAMLRMNPGQNISLSGAAAAGVPYRILLKGVELSPEDLPMQLASRTGKSILDVDLDIVRADGSVLNTLSYAVPVFDREHRLRRVINACVDITERKRSELQRKELEDRLIRAEKYRSLALMAGGVAHDFNNLLTAIIGYSEIAQREFPPGGPAGRAIREVLGAAERAADLASQLLAYTGHAWFELKPLDLSAEVRTMEAEIRAMAPREIEIEFQLTPGLPAIPAGAREVRQVITNLVANAAEAIGERRGTIQVRVGRCTLGPEDLARDYPDQELVPGTYVRLEVSDSGAGVSRELAARVFDPFFTTKFLGRGLGLSAVHGIMRAHRGGVRFDTSTTLGARVQAIFPVSAAAGVRDRVA